MTKKYTKVSFDSKDVAFFRDERRKFNIGAGLGIFSAVALVLGLTIAGAILIAWPLALAGFALIAIILTFTLVFLVPEYKFHSLLHDKADSELEQHGTLEDSNVTMTRYLVNNIQDRYITSMAVEIQEPWNAVPKTRESKESESDLLPVNAEDKILVCEISGKDGASAYMNHLRFIHNHNQMLPLIPYELNLGNDSNRPATYNYK